MPTITWPQRNVELTYTGKPADLTVPAVTLVNHESFNGTITYFNPKDGTVYNTLTLTISYMDPPEDILYNGGAKQNDYGRNEVVISARGIRSVRAKTAAMRAASGRPSSAVHRVRRFITPQTEACLTVVLRITQGHLW